MTARFHDMDAAKAAGYELGYERYREQDHHGCIAHPTAGAMGYHYFNKALIDDLVVDVSKPEDWSTRRHRTGAARRRGCVVPGAGSNPPGASSRRPLSVRRWMILVPAAIGQ